MRAGRRRPRLRDVILRPREAGLPSAEVERAFFNALRLRNGVFKTTAVGRLADVDAFLDAHLPAGRRLAIMDVAVSSGVTTSEWMRHLEARGIDHEMVAGDVTMRGQVISVPGVLDVLLDGDGYPLQFDVAGVALPSSPGTRGAFLAHRVLRRLALGVGALGGLGEGASWGPVERRVVDIVSPRVTRGVTPALVDDDLLRPNPRALVGRFDVVRAANILNPSYFDAGTIREIARRLIERLTEDGLLLVCKTEDDGSNTGSLLRRDGSDVAVIARHRGGVIVEGLLTEGLLTEAQ